MTTLTLSDTSGATVTYNDTKIGVPITISSETGKSTNTTLNGNVYTDFTYNKKGWKFKIDYMTSDEYVVLKGFYDRQFTLSKYPTATIVLPSGTTTAVVALELNNQEIITNCGIVEDVEITLRETVQL